MLKGVLQKMVLVISSINNREVMERWTFDIITDKQALGGG
jgi:hypothetical protein